jgi:hypothetical protein
MATSSHILQARRLPLGRVERVRYQNVLPAANNLARELDISDSSIDEMVLFGRNEQTCTYYLLLTINM